MQNNNVLDDKEILSLFKVPQTKEKAYEILIKKYQERIYWHIRKLVISHEDSNDIIQNTFVNVWLSLENFREESQIYTWIYRIATNECLKFIEKKKKQNQISFEDKQEYLENTIKADKDFDSEKLEWRLQEAILKLPEKQRVVFNLRYYEEMPYEDMSKILDTSVGALKASYFHAANKVEEYIKQTI